MEMVLVRELTRKYTSLLLLAGLFLVGCQGYKPMPLQPEDHMKQWLERTPRSEGVVEFARKLSEEDPGAIEYDPDDGIDLAEAQLIAMVFNPKLRLARKRAGVAAATAENAGLWDDPSFSIDVLRITESVANPWVIMPGLSLTIPISGRLEVEKSRADALMQEALVRVAGEEWLVRQEVRDAWARWSASLLAAEEAGTLIESIEQMVEMTGRLADLGELRRTEAGLFRIENAQRVRELAGLEARALSNRQQLHMLLGLSPDAPLELLPSLDVFVPGEVDIDLTMSNPELRRLREAYEVAEHSLQLEVRKQYPDLTIGPLYETDQGQSRIGFLGGIPIPVLNANRQGIAEATARRELARAEFEAAVEILEGTIAMTRIRMTALEEEYGELVRVIGPMVDQQVADARTLIRLGEAGEGGTLVLLESIVRLHETKTRMIRVLMDQALECSRLEYLLGPGYENDSTWIQDLDNEETEVTR
ncbi:MAG: hypothetical protein CMJ32_11300 [Phycisphaerae bacterium]|nr:hypothetical protein [Phycisphaerae bacterium]